jgi:hypothetical protein
MGPDGIIVTSSRQGPSAGQVSRGWKRKNPLLLPYQIRPWVSSVIEDTAVTGDALFDNTGWSRPASTRERPSAVPTHMRPRRSSKTVRTDAPTSPCAAVYVAKLPRFTRARPRAEWPTQTLPSWSR